MTNPYLRWLSGPHPRATLLVLGLATACSKKNEVDSGTNIASQCSSSSTDLSKLCPAGTALEAHAAATDPAACKEGSGTADGGIQSVCRIEGSCALQCKVILDCPCGASLVSKEQVKCNSCTICGNAKVETGEECDQGDKNGTGQGCDKNCKLTQGTPCGTNGDLRCSGDSSAVQICVDNLWQDRTKCTTDQTCKSNQCVVLDNYCPSPGETQCVGAFRRQVCGDDHRWADQVCPIEKPVCRNSGGQVVCVAEEEVATSSTHRLELRVQPVTGRASDATHVLLLGDGRRR